MASPVGSTWRNTCTSPEYGHLVRSTTLLLAAVESHAGSYSSANFATLTSKLGDAISALNDAAAADGDAGNNGYPA